jgi:hypothetical protein
MARFSTAELNAAGAGVFAPGTTYYLSLHSADPGTTGASEFSGGSYARQAIVFSTWTAGATGNNAAIAVPNAGTTAATYVGIWTAATAGTYLGGLPLASAVTSTSVTFAIGAIAPTVTG